MSRCVRELCGCGHREELQWLEAYFADEARDRTLDGVFVCLLAGAWLYVCVFVCRGVGGDVCGGE